MHIGIDVGGTNTDAVIVQDGRVLARAKRPTSGDVLSGIRAALAALRDAAPAHFAMSRAVMLGTTHFTNAVVSANGLSRTAAVRLGLPAARAIPALSDWPRRLVEAIGRHVYEAHGGREFDGRPISPLDPAELRTIAADIRAQKIEAVAITGIFAPLAPDDELMARDILAAELPGVRFTLSHQIGRVGLLERENATIINAALLKLASHTTDAFEAALSDSGLSVPLYLTQNDGTLMDVATARAFPVTTFSSGPTNSMRGAALLSGLRDCIVVDIGGTTADVGILVDGFPRAAAAHVDVGGVRTNFRMPDLLPLGIGGGSLVDLASNEVGPASVGYRLTEQARVFGGDILTATDVAVAAGVVEIGDGALTGIGTTQARAILDRIAARIAEAADMMRTSPDPIPVVLVGGGAILIDGDLPGLGPVVRPRDADVANAVGAAIAQVGGEVDKVIHLEGLDRTATLAAIAEEARRRAVDAGAVPDTVNLLELEETPLAYLPGDCVRIRAKAVGDLALEER